MATLNRSAIKRARDTAKVFVEEFPGQTPDVTWLAEAASIDHIKDDVRDAWMDEVRAEVERMMDVPDTDPTTGG